MHDELDKDLSLSTLAAESGYSRAHFMRMFKATIGETPHRYLLELRLRKAQAMIAERSKRVIDIAMECGFSSHAHFTVAFSQRFGARSQSLPKQSLLKLAVFKSMPAGLYPPRGEVHEEPACVVRSCTA